MEKTPTFTLPSEFLIWVAARVLVDCSLDLILTEYYKERLESQLKNRETGTHAHITSVKWTDNPRLNLPTDWKTCNKPSDPRLNSYALPTPPLSPLSLPSPSTQSITTVSYCCKEICSSLQSTELSKGQTKILSMNELYCIMDNISDRLNYIERKSVFLSVFRENSITPSFDN